MKYAISTIIICTSMYLCGCFVQASFDITKWDIALRATVATMAFVLSAATTGTMAQIENEAN